MEKKASHVGLVLSFVIFVTFIFFVFSILNPAVKKEKSKQIIIEIAKENLVRNLVSNVSITSLKVKNIEDVKKSCFKIDEFIDDEEKTSKVKNPQDENSGGSVSGGKIEVIHGGQEFFKIYSSSKFEEEESEPCDALKPEDYILGLTKEEEYFFVEDIHKIMQEYDEDYYGVKEKLGITQENEFGISFVDNSEEEIQKGFETNSGNVYIEEIPIQYYDLNATIKFGRLKIRIW